ncbi:MAG: hypothetical protein Fur0024_0140 [Patescibacteria group bacterium]
MKLSYNFLQTFFDEKLPDPYELAKFMTLNIAENDPVVNFGEKYKDIEIVQVVKIENHPNAEKLVLLEVKKFTSSDFRSAATQEGNYQVVTGAKNLSVGDKIAIVEKGGTIPGGFGNPSFVVESKDLRGVMSERVALSQKELGLGLDHTGIFVFPPDIKLGKLLEVLPYFKDYVLEIDNKALSNRADMFSYIGVAREIGAFLNLKVNFKFPEVELVESKEKIFGLFDSRIKRFALSKFSFSEQKSDLYISQILASNGIRPISRLVDATNFAMIVTGQPFHVFDYQKLKKVGDGKVEVGVRVGKMNEKFTTLDGVERVLNENDLLVTNNSIPVGLAGVMGGLETEADENTREVLIESASFPPNLIRKTSRRFELLSEAAQRFEHGVDFVSIDLAQKFILNHLGVSQAEFYDYKNFDEEKKVIFLPKNFAEKIIGHSIDLDFQIDCLKKIGCEVTDPNSISKTFVKNSETGEICEIDSSLPPSKFSDLNGKKWYPFQEEDCLTVSIPFWRFDLEIAEDLVEEIGRMDSLTKIIDEPIVGASKPSKKETWMDLEFKLRDLMVGMGFTEIYTYSFMVDEKYGDILTLDKSKYLEIINAPSKKMSFLRSQISVNLLDVLEKNRGFYDEQMIFEIGKVFEKPNNTKNLPVQENKEWKSFGFAILSKSSPQLIMRRISGVLKTISDNFGIEFSDLNSKIRKWFINDSEIKIKSSNAILCEISLTDLENTKKSLNKKFKDVPKFPVIVRDVNYELQKDKKTLDLKNQVEEKLKIFRHTHNNKDDIMISFEVVDLFETNEFKRFTVRFEFSSENRTLESVEVEEILEKLK